MEMSVKNLTKKQQEHCKKYNLGLSTKRTNLIHDKNIGHIAGANEKLVVTKSDRARVRN